jgi:hypothetical protein
MRLFVDPNALTPAEWKEMGHLLSTLWGVVALIVFFAANLLIGHIWIPSFVQSGHLPANLGKTRPMFYFAAIASFGGAIYLLSKVADFAGVLRLIYDKFWV